MEKFESWILVTGWSVSPRAIYPELNDTASLITSNPTIDPRFFLPFWASWTETEVGSSETWTNVVRRGMKESKQSEGEGSFPVSFSQPHVQRPLRTIRFTCDGLLFAGSTAKLLPTLHTGVMSLRLLHSSWNAVNNFELVALRPKQTWANTLTDWTVGSFRLVWCVYDLRTYDYLRLLAATLTLGEVFSRCIRRYCHGVMQRA